MEYSYKTIEAMIENFTDWYILKIREAAKKAGGMAALSVKLGYSEKSLSHCVSRRSFLALRRVVKRLKVK